VYNAVRSSPNWASTMLIITCDEHGGCYDHIPPPAAVPPEKPRPGQVFAFDRYGVRVPAVIVSPYTKPETILRASGPQPFDHTSIIRTVRACFGLATPLSAREASAPDLSGALNDSLNLDRAPAQLAVTAPQPSAGALQAAQDAVPNGLQTLFQDIAAKLAPLIHPDVSVDQHLQTVVQPNSLAPPMTGNAAQAGAYAANVMKSLSDAFASGQAQGPHPAAQDSVYFGGS
jgi:phospholipase C